MTPNLHGGGAEAIAREWITELQADGHPITVYAYDREQPNVDLPPGVTIHKLSHRGGPFRPALMPRWLRDRVRRDEPDVVLSLMTFSNVISLLALKARPRSTVPLMVSDHTVQRLHAVNIRRREQMTEWVARRMYRRASGALAVSHAVATELVSAFRVPGENIFVVPNPVVRLPSASAREAEAIPNDLHLVHVGRHVAQKRPHLFLEVIHELMGRGVAARGSVIGDGPMRESTELKSAELGLDIAFLGWREPWWDAVSNVDCLVLTANVEGLGNVLIEAAAAGIPSVATSRALGVADAIVPGITGELALTDDPRAYADAVLRAARLELDSPTNVGAWLERFSSVRSTDVLLDALIAIM